MLPRPTYTGQKDGSEPIDLFVNRGHHIALFTRQALSISEATHQVLSFHGMGGQGKTLLLQKFATIIKDDPSLSDVHWGIIDFHELKEREPIYILLWIRNALVRTGRIKLPSFDLAFELYWKETHSNRPLPQMENRWLGTASDLSEAGIDTAIDLAREGATGLLEGLPFVGHVLKRVGGYAIRRGHEEFHLRTNATLKHLFHRGELVGPSVFEERLPFILGCDLTNWREHHSTHRMLLLIDEYETALELGGVSDLIIENLLDKTVREVVASCAATLFVFFSREPLRWEETDAGWAPCLAGRQHRLDGLTYHDADQLLQRAGVDDAGVRIAMIEAATVEAADDHAPEAYPYMLDLSIKHWNQCLQNGVIITPDLFDLSGISFAVRRRELLGRLLRSYQRPDLYRTLPRLAVARRIDQELFEYVVTVFSTYMPHDDWKIIANLSIFRKYPEGEITFHTILREGLESLLSRDELTQTNAALFEYFDRKARPYDGKTLTWGHANAAVEAFHHKRAVDGRGALLWWSQLGRAFHDAGLERAVEVIDREAIHISVTEFGDASNWHASRLLWYADSLDRQGRHAEAEPLRRRALEIDKAALGLAHRDIATSLGNLASNLDMQGRHAEAEPLHRRALEIDKAALGPAHRDTVT